MLPTLNIIASDPNIDTLWYKIGSNEINITQIFQDFDATIWDSLDEGRFQINIFANDTFGNINNTNSLTLYKDTLPPKIVINSPLNQTFWNSRPILNITVFDPNLKSIYYRVSTATFWLENNTQKRLSSFTWANLAEGEFKIQFFAEDLVGNINDSYTLTLFKDTIKPNITINSPLTDSLYGKNAPEFNISASKFNLDKVWYSLIGYPEDYILNNFNGIINQTAWDFFGSEIVTIRFYANDTTGNIRIEDITVRKDINAPTIEINQLIKVLVWDFPPTINVSVSDPNLDSIWYRIGTRSSILNNNIEQQVDSLIWEDIPQGEFRIYIHANDTFGNVNDSFYLALYKDTLAPNITINLPDDYQEIEDIAPQYDLTIVEDNLATRWYTLDGGLTNKTFNNNIGSVDQQIWDGIWESHADGDLITIRFYANDTLNHLGYQDVIIKVKKPGLFELTNPTMLITTGTLGSVIGITTVSVKKSKKYKRMDNKQKKKVNSIFYLSLLLTGLFLLTSFI